MILFLRRMYRKLRNLDTLQGLQATVHRYEEKFEEIRVFYDDPRRALLDEAALILEQEGWLIGRAAHDTGSRRLCSFEERYRAWQDKVNAFRRENPDWRVPPDNS